MEIRVSDTVKVRVVFASDLENAWGIVVSGPDEDPVVTLKLNESFPAICHFRDNPAALVAAACMYVATEIELGVDESDLNQMVPECHGMDFHELYNHLLARNPVAAA